jgi:hypothetical protein
MKINLIFKIMLCIAIACITGYLADDSAYKALETAIAGAIGAIVGGVLAALAFAFSIIAKLNKQALTSERAKSDVMLHYSAVTTSLYGDIKALIWCLLFAILLPFFRGIVVQTNVSKYLVDASNAHRIITSLEVLIVLISISVLFEVCACMFQTLIADSFPDSNT